MPELIERQAAIRCIKEHFCDECNQYNELNCIDSLLLLPTVEADIDRASILRLCNEIEEIVTAIANWSENWQTVDDCRTVCGKLKEIGKELTGDAGTD